MEKSNDLRNMLLELDRQFDRDTAVGGGKTWASYFAEDGVMVGTVDIKGREAIYNQIGKSFSLPGFSLRWEPTDARISEDGSLGYTYGNYVRKYLNQEGEEVSSTGRYTTIWQKQEDNTWKIVLDIGN